MVASLRRPNTRVIRDRFRKFAVSKATPSAFFFIFLHTLFSFLFRFYAVIVFGRKLCFAM